MKNSQQLKKFGLLIIGVLALGLFFYFRSQSSPPVESESMTKKTVVETNKNSEVVEIEMSSFQFSQDTLTFKAGQTVTIKLTNSDSFHDLVVDGLGVASEQISAGDETSITFTLPKDSAGKTYEYYCSVGNHRELGMVGLLTVKK